MPDKQIYQILETAGANKKQNDRYGFTPFDYLTNGKLTIRDLLIKYSNDDDDNDMKKKNDADLWERPPTSEIVSRMFYILYIRVCNFLSLFPFISLFFVVVVNVVV